MKKVAVILSGCGVFDGSEVYESVLTLLHVSKLGASYSCFAPDIEQMHTLNHITGEEMQPNRNVLIEAARITRGDIKALSELNVDDFDALIIPGGFGSAKNLSDFATKGAEASVQQDVLVACQAFAEVRKPAGYICISPALVPLIYGAAKTTIGNDADTAAAVTALGGEHVACAVDDIVVDEEKRVVTTPAYMLAQSILEADAGIAKLVQRVISMID